MPRLLYLKSHQLLGQEKEAKGELHIDPKVTHVHWPKRINDWTVRGCGDKDPPCAQMEESLARVGT